MADNELVYVVRLTTEGKPEIVEATEGMEDHHAAVLSAREGIDTLGKSYSNVNELTDQARQAFRKTSAETQTLSKNTNTLSTAERNLEQIMQETGERLQENTFHLEAARLEYEDGSITQEQYADRLRGLKTELEGIDAPSIQLIRRQRQINSELKTMNPQVQTAQRSLSSTNSALFSTASALTRVNPAFGTTASTALSVARSLGQVSTQSGSALGAFRQIATFAMSPTGMIAVFSLLAAGIAFAASKLDLFGTKSEEFEENANQMVKSVERLNEQISELLGFEGIFDDREQRLLIASIQEVRMEVQQQLNEVKANRQEFQGTQYYTREQRQQMKQLEEDIDAYTETLEKAQGEIRRIERLRESDAIRTMEYHRILLELEERRSQARQEFMEEHRNKQEVILDEEIELGEDLLDAELKRGNEFLKMEEDLRRMRLDMRRMEADEIELLEIEKEERIRELNNRELESSWQHNQALQMIEEEFAQKEMRLREEIADHNMEVQRQIADERRRIETELASDRIAVNMMAADALQVINENMLGGSKELAVLAFAAQRALAIKQMLVDAESKATQAQAQGHVLAANPVTAALAANAFAQAAAIRANAARSAGLMAAMSLAEGVGIARGGGSGGGSRGGDGETIGYRGFSFGQTESPVNRAGMAGGMNNDQSGSETANGPRKLIIEDGFGNIVARGIEENDRSGGNNGYVRRQA